MAYTLNEIRRKRDSAEQRLAEYRLRAERETSPTERQEFRGTVRYYEQKVEEYTLMIRAKLAEEAHKLLRSQRDSELANAWAYGYEAGRRDATLEVAEGRPNVRENPYGRCSGSTDDIPAPPGRS